MGAMILLTRAMVRSFGQNNAEEPTMLNEVALFFDHQALVGAQHLVVLGYPDSFGWVCVYASMEESCT